MVVGSGWRVVQGDLVSQAKLPMKVAMYLLDFDCDCVGAVAFSNLNHN